MNLVFPGVGHLITTHKGVGNLIASFDFMLRRADSTWRGKSWRRQALMHTQFVADWLKNKLCSVFEGIQEPFVLSLACKSGFF